MFGSFVRSGVMYYRLHKGGVKIPYTHRAGLGTRAIVAGFWRFIPLQFWNLACLVCVHMYSLMSPALMGQQMHALKVYSFGW